MTAAPRLLCLAAPALAVLAALGLVAAAMTLRPRPAPARGDIVTILPAVADLPAPTAIGQAAPRETASAAPTRAEAIARELLTVPEVSLAQVHEENERTLALTRAHRRELVLARLWKPGWGTYLIHDCNDCGCAKRCAGAGHAYWEMEEALRALAARPDTGDETRKEILAGLPRS